MAYKFEQLDVWQISAKRLFAFRKALKSSNKSISEEEAVYDTDLFE